MAALLRFGRFSITARSISCSLLLLLPTLKVLDINLIHFAIILTANIEIASITPPVGFNLFVISGTAKVSIGEVAKGVLPFCLALLAGLFILTYVPSISLALLP